VKFIVGVKFYTPHFIEGSKVLKSAMGISLAVVADQLPDVSSRSVATSVLFCGKTVLLQQCNQKNCRERQCFLLD